MSARDRPGRAQRIDWLVFAEDWGGHPSTTQHLVAHLPEGDRVLWVDSIGMRSPRLVKTDLARIARRLTRVLAGESEREGRATRPAGRSPDAVLRPLILPWHDQAVCVALNRALLGTMVRREARRLGMSRPVLLAATPVVARYAAQLHAGSVVYLRLDEFASLPGVDPELIHATEPEMLRRSDLVVAPSPRLVPADVAPARVRVLPQGVDIAAFDAVPVDPPDTKGRVVIGYWGAVGEWFDFELVHALAKARPEVVLEIRGSPRAESGVLERIAALASLSNVRFLPQVPHGELARAAAHWRGAWAPFLRGLHLEHASPLKLREYLAAGLPAASAPIPEAREIDGLTMFEGLDQVLAWIDDAVIGDTRARRIARRERMAGEGWAHRARDLRGWVADLDGGAR